MDKYLKYIIVAKYIYVKTSIFRQKHKRVSQSKKAFAKSAGRAY